MYSLLIFCILHSLLLDNNSNGSLFLLYLLVTSLLILLNNTVLSIHDISITFLVVCFFIILVNEISLIILFNTLASFLSLST